MLYLNEKHQQKHFDKKKDCSFDTLLLASRALLFKKVKQVHFTLEVVAPLIVVV